MWYYSWYSLVVHYYRDLKVLNFGPARCRFVSALSMQWLNSCIRVFLYHVSPDVFSISSSCFPLFVSRMNRSMCFWRIHLLTDHVHFIFLNDRLFTSRGDILEKETMFFWKNHVVQVSHFCICKSAKDLEWKHATSTKMYSSCHNGLQNIHRSEVQPNRWVKHSRSELITAVC